MNIITGYIIYIGSVTVDGMDILIEEAKKRIGYLPETRPVSCINVWDYLNFVFDLKAIKLDEMTFTGSNANR